MADNQLKPAIKPKVILVTGAAGFIGHALSLELIKEHPDNVVIGVDDFNDYYDVRLKMVFSIVIGWQILNRSQQFYCIFNFVNSHVNICYFVKAC